MSSSPQAQPAGTRTRARRARATASITALLCACSSSPPPGGAPDAATDDAPVTMDLPIAMDVPVVMDVPVAMDAPVATDVSADAGPSCPGTQQRCGDACVEVMSDPAHCGGCGAACPTGQLCAGGRCALACAAPRTVCGAMGEMRCVDLGADSTHCGVCGNACPTGQSCAGGRCVLDCAAPQTVCVDAMGAMRCLDLATDRSSCGACGNACAAGLTCVEGACALVCPAGQTICGDRCVDLRADNAHCGACSNACASGRECRVGSCVVVCPSGQTLCGDGCVDPRTDPGHCGLCGNACAVDEVCTSGACGCPTGQTRCGDACVTTSSDARNCGACGVACPSTQNCIAGACSNSPPANDLPAGAIALSLARPSVNVTGTTASAANNSGCLTGGDVYYRFTLTQREVVYADTFGTGYDTALAFAPASGVGYLPGTCIDDTTAMECGAFSLQTRLARVLDPGSYYLVVSGFGTATGPFTLHVQHFPVGGTVTQLTALTGEQTVMGTTTGSSALTTSCGNGAGPENTYWFMTCPNFAATTLVANTCGGASHDTVLEQRSGNRTAHACNDDACGVQSRVESTIDEGAALHVLYVDGYASSNAGAYALSLRWGPCPAGRSACGATCLDLQTESANCGACGVRCPAGSTCAAGRCECAGGQLACGGACVDGQTDRANCGRCGNACGGGLTCVEGVCACANGQSACGSACRDLASDAANCGACGRMCPSGQSCVAGACACPSTQTLCGGACRDLQSDVANCGTCGLACPAPAGGTAACVMGACATACPSGQSNCGGTCRATGGACMSAGGGGCQTRGVTVCSGSATACSAAPRSTGACTAPAGGVCGAGGACACPSGQMDCGGTCRSLATDSSHCGACGRACAAGEVCSSGACTRVCAAGQTQCGSQCVSTANDAANCGACGRACAAGQVCSAGACGCPAGQTDCGGVCRDLQRDSGHCGACGRACAAPTGGTASCAAGSCLAVCPTGQSNCGGVCRVTGTACTSAGTGGCQSAGTIVCAGTSTTCSATPRTSGSCTAPGNGVCGAGGVCGCASPRVNCGGVCVTLGGACTSAGGSGCQTTGVTQCVGGRAVCSATPRTSGACFSPLFGVCGAGGACACAEGTLLSGSSCWSAPRQVRPLSTATVTSRRPELHWVLRSGAAGARVELCRNRAMTSGCLAPIDASGWSTTLTADLAPGTWFWRLMPLAGTTALNVRGPVWQFNVGLRSAGRNTSWGTTLDVNGDGFADVAVGPTSRQPHTARIFYGRAGGPATTPSVSLAQPGGFTSNFGSSVASAGDVNGDGYADLIVGAPVMNYGTGAAYLYLGGPSGISTTPTTTLEGLVSGVSYFGGTVASAGDVNGDGYADVIIGADRIANNTGAAYLYLGSATGLSTTPTTTLAGPGGAGGLFGCNLASAGDVNGDGYSDLIIGARYVDQLGVAYLFHGSLRGISSTPTTTLLSPNRTRALFGGTVASADDVNGDGFADVIVGANAESVPSAMSLGRAYVYLGGTGGVATTVNATLNLTGTYGNFGWVVASAGDVNRDGYSDVVVGQPGYDLPPFPVGDIGAAYLFHGGPSGVSTTIATMFVSPARDTGFGRSLGGVGDTSGDGYADLLVRGGTGVGVGYVYLGTSTGLPTTASTILTSP